MFPTSGEKASIELPRQSQGLMPYRIVRPNPNQRQRLLDDAPIVPYSSLSNTAMFKSIKSACPRLFHPQNFTIHPHSLVILNYEVLLYSRRLCLSRRSICSDGRNDYRGDSGLDQDRPDQHIPLVHQNGNRHCCLSPERIPRSYCPSSFRSR